MLLKDMRTNEVRPEIVVDPTFTERTVLFGFDEDRYKEGMAIAEVPESVADNLQITFTNASGQIYGINSRYDVARHQLNFDIGYGKPTKIKSVNIGPWPVAEETKQNSINFSLAYHASVISQYALRHPDTLVIERVKGPNYVGSRLLSNVFFVAAGGMAGAHYHEELGLPPGFGSLIGALGGFGLDIVGHYLFEKMRDATDVENARKDIDGRAKTFARSDAAKSIFSQVVELQMHTNQK